MTLQWFNQSEQILFGRHIAPEVTALLQQAAYASSLDHGLAEKKLWQAQQLHPAQLEIYIAIYKFYLQRGHLQEARHTLQQALIAAARAGGFPSDWHQVTVTSCDWRDSESPQRVFLYALKALGSLLQRVGAIEESYRALEKLYEIDPQDQSGITVMRELAKGIINGDS